MYKTHTMTSKSSICSLCFNNAEDKNLHVINTSIQDMLRTLLINIDISASEHSVICWTCHRKLENYYCFKKKCIFTEDTLRPFVAENVKTNLNEIRSQIIKSEAEVEKNVCRLCLQYSDDDMTLNEDETQQVQDLFPEINLNFTNFVILCLTCYNTLHKYFTFVMPLHLNRTFGNPSKDNHKTSTNVEELNEKNVLLLTGEMGIKNEEDSSDFLEEKLDIGVEQIIDMKSEDTKLSLMEIEESDDVKPVLLHEELDIKCHGDSSDEECLYTSSSFTLQPVRVQIENRRLVEPNCDGTGSRSLPKENYTNRQKDAVLIGQADSSKIRVSKCVQCDYESKCIDNLERHILFHHPNGSKTTMYKCDKCDYECTSPDSLKKHIRIREECSYEAKYKASMKRPMLTHTTNLSETKTHKCDKCDYESKSPVNLNLHFIRKHTDPSEIQTYKCKECSYESKRKENLKRHMLNHAKNLSEITMYKCDVCDYISIQRKNLKQHYISKHVNPSEIQMTKCNECSYKTRHKKYMKQHMLTHATNLSEFTIYKCDKCDFESKWRKSLKMHFNTKHTDSSEIQMHKCKQCNYETKHKGNVKRHMLIHTTNVSENATHKCDKCKYEH